MQVKEVSTNGIMVERGFLNSTAGSHTAGDDILKNGMWSARNSISKDILKPDTLYDLSFWTKIKTGTAATASIVVATGAHSSLGDFVGYTITLKSTAGTVKTYKFYNSSAGDNTDIDSDGNIKIDINGSSDITTIGARIEAAIEHANGHNGEIAVANSSGTLTLTQAYAGEEGNTNITYGGGVALADLSTMNTAFTGGKSPKPVFCLDYNGGYFDENGDFQLKTISDGDDVAGYEHLTSSIPTYNIKWNPFSVCTSDFEDTISTSNIDSVKWRKISYTFRTPNEMPKNDLELNFSNFGENATAIQLAVVSLSETCFVTAETEDAPNITASSFIKHSDLQTLVMYNKTSSSLSAIENFTTHLKEPLKSNTSFETSPYVENNFNSSNVSMVQKNRELHIGFGGKEQNSRPAWLGYLNSKLFNRNNEGLYLDQSAVSSYETAAEVSYSKMCLAGEHECITATWDNSATTLTVDMGSGVAHNLIAGDNITIREYLDTDNSWAGTGVWFVSALDNAAGDDETRYFRCRRNTSLDVNPANNDSMAGDNNYKISWRPYFYYAIKKGTRFLYRIWPDDRISGTSASDIGTDEYVKGYTEKFLDFDFPVQSICTSYSKNGTTPDGGYVYILEEGSSTIRRINVVAGYNLATETRLTAFETITINTKSFKWSNDNVNGNIGGSTAVYDSLAAESSPDIEHSGEFSDIIETKGPTTTFDWDDTTNTNSDVSPANFDTRLWVQSYPHNSESFSTGDRFLFCGKSTYVSGSNDMNFADRTPPTTTLYGDVSNKTSMVSYNPDITAAGYGASRFMYGYGPYVDINNTNSEMLGNDDDAMQETIKASSYFDVVFNNGNVGEPSILKIKPFKSFNYDENRPENIEDIEGEELSVSNLNYGQHYNSYINFGYNPGWYGDGSKTASIRVARYGLFAVTDNNCDGMLDGTGVVVPNNDNYSSNKHYGELHRKVSAHAVGIIGGSDIPWIGYGGQLNGKNTGYSIGKATEHILNKEASLNADAPYNVDMSNCVFICTDMHFGDLPQKQKYTISALATDADIGGCSDASKYTKVTTSEDHYLQAGDLVYFKGNGTWPGFYSDGAPGIYSATAAQSNKGSYTVIAVPSSTTFYVAESSAATGMDSGAEVWVGGPWMNEDNGVIADAGRTVTDLYHYAFDKDNKNNSDIFKSGHFGPKWYSEQALFQFSALNMTDALMKKLFPAKSFSIERLKWEAGFLIRPFHSDINLDIDAQTSVEMPVFPDKVYHSGATVKSVGADNIENQFSSKLFIAKNGEYVNGEIENTKLWIFNLNNDSIDTSNYWSNQIPTIQCYYHNHYSGGNISHMAGPDPSTTFGPSMFLSTERLNNSANSQGQVDWIRNPSLYNSSATPSIIISYHDSSTTDAGLEDATKHPVVKVPRITSFPGKYKNAFAGYCITIIDALTNIHQTRKIIGSMDDGTNTLLSIHYPFGHTPQYAESCYIYHSSRKAVAPIGKVGHYSGYPGSLGKREIDPILRNTVYKESGGGTVTGDGSTATLTTPNAYTKHMLTSKDIINISSGVYSGNYEITVTGPNTFTFPSTNTDTVDVSYTFVNSNASPSNPIVIPAVKPKMSVHFGGLHSRRLRSFNVTATADDGNNIAATSTGHTFNTGNDVIFKTEVITAVKNRDFSAASDWVEYSPSSTLGAFGDDANPEYLEITGTSATSKEGAELGTGSMATIQNGQTYRVSVDIWSASGTMTGFKVEIGGVASSAFSINSNIRTYVRTITATGSGNLRIYNELNSTTQWYIDNVSVQAVSQEGFYIGTDADANTIDLLNPDFSTDTNGTLFTNQWEGVISSTSGQTRLGEFRAGLTKFSKGPVDGNILRGDTDDDTKYISVAQTSLDITPSSISETGYFLKNNIYSYKISLMYDGYQEGPLSEAPWTFEDNSAREKLYIDLKLNITKLSKRLTHVCLYRKNNPESFYRLVRQISTDTGWNMPETEIRSISITDDGKLGASYEARTNISETNTDLSVKYGLSVEVNGYLFAGDCSHSQINDASNQIFRSKIGRFSLFDWTRDFVILKSKPTAMTNFAGRLFVFDENNIYKINPESLQIEDTFEGIGCSGSNSVVVTEFGMFFANRNGAYMHNGTSPQKLSTQIQTGGKTNMLSLTSSSAVGTKELEDLSWSNTAGNINNRSPLVSFDPTSNCVLFFVEFRDNDYIKTAYQGSSAAGNIESTKNISVINNLIWSYCLNTRRWDLWELDKNKVVGKPFTDKEGIVCVNIGNNIYSLFTSANKKLYSWLSKKLTLDAATVNKVYNKIKIVGPKSSLINDGTYDSETDKLIVSTDKGRITSGSNSTTANMVVKSDGTETFDYRLTGSNKKGKWMQFKLEEMDEEVDSIGLLFRIRTPK